MRIGRVSADSSTQCFFVSAESMSDDSANPYQPSAVVTANVKSGVYRYRDLPRRCPRCERQFSEILYKRLYPRRYRFGTIAFVVVLTIFSLGILGWFGFIPLFFLGGWAMNWPKKTRVYCTSCGWSQNYIVSTRG